MPEDRDAPHKRAFGRGHRDQIRTECLDLPDKVIEHVGELLADTFGRGRLDGLEEQALLRFHVRICFSLEVVPSAVEEVDDEATVLQEPGEQAEDGRNQAHVALVGVEEENANAIHSHPPYSNAPGAWSGSPSFTAYAPLRTARSHATRGNTQRPACGSRQHVTCRSP